MFFPDRNLILSAVGSAYSASPAGPFSPAVTKSPKTPYSPESKKPTALTMLADLALNGGRLPLKENRQFSPTVSPAQAKVSTLFNTQVNKENEFPINSTNDVHAEQNQEDIICDYMQPEVPVVQKIPNPGNANVQAHFTELARLLDIEAGYGYAALDKIQTKDRQEDVFKRRKDILKQLKLILKNLFPNDKSWKDGFLKANPGYTLNHFRHIFDSSVKLEREFFVALSNIVEVPESVMKHFIETRRRKRKAQEIDLE